MGRFFCDRIGHPVKLIIRDGDKYLMSGCYYCLERVAAKEPKQKWPDIMYDPHPDDIMFLAKNNQLLLHHDLADFLEEHSFAKPKVALTMSEFQEFWELFELWWKELQE